MMLIGALNSSCCLIARAGAAPANDGIYKEYAFDKPNHSISMLTVSVLAHMIRFSCSNWLS
jgi:hypothetical protein